jgi:ABC-2 type transport system ATP-binding protein
MRTARHPGERSGCRPVVTNPPFTIPRKFVTMIEINSVSKHFGDKTAVDDLSFTIQPGIVTGFLGPNGAGKSTTMRMILGLDRPTAGHILVDGQRFRDEPAPLTKIGALLDSKGAHPGRTAFAHLNALAATHGIPRSQVQHSIELVGLEDAAKRRAGGFSLGMSQRLGIAAALLANPEIVILDEPVNGLDPDGVVWIRNLLKELARQGRTVFVSSHLMSEMAMTAEHLIVIGRGRLIADTGVSEFIASASQARVRVRTSNPAELGRLLTSDGVTITTTNEDPGLLEVTGRTAEQVGTRAANANIPVFELSTSAASLEEAFMELTRDSVEYGTHARDTEGVQQ